MIPGRKRLGASHEAEMFPGLACGWWFDSTCATLRKVFFDIAGIGKGSEKRICADSYL